MYFPNGLYAHCIFIVLKRRTARSRRLAERLGCWLLISYSLLSATSRHHQSGSFFARYFQCFMLKEIRKKSERDSVEAEKARE
jgi:hypothetical protein